MILKGDKFYVYGKIAFDIISLAGDAKAELQKALEFAHKGEFNNCEN